MRVRYTPRAFADREAIFEYLDQRSPRAAHAVKAFIKKQIDDLQYFPERYPSIQERNVRALWLVRYPYVVYYRIRGEEISILHIRHTSRQPWPDGD
jgi:plasmid stabilization system protein ParE